MQGAVLKFFLLFISVISLVSGKDYCILASSNPTKHIEDEKMFLTRYPSSGTIEKYKDLYEYKIYTQRNYSDSKVLLKQVKKNYKGAFLINCTPKNGMKSSVTNVKVVQQKKIEASQILTPNKEVPLKEKVIKSEHLVVDAKKISYVDITPSIDEPIILQKHQIPDLYKTDIKQKYDTLSLQTYMDAFLKHNDNVDEAYYQKKIEELMVEIRKDYYNFDVYVDGYIRTGKSVPAQGNGINVAGDYTGAGVAINANKVLWNGHYNLINNTYDILNNRLSEIKELNAKDKLAVLGVSLYTGLFYSQEKLRILEKMYTKQKEMVTLVKEGYKIGKYSAIAHLDAQNDLLNLQKDLQRLREVHRHNSYLLRDSMESKSLKPLHLSEPKIDFELTSLSEIEKEALKNSNEIALSSNRLQLSKADLLFQKRRFYPEIKFNSYLGYGAGNLNIFDVTHIGSGEYWELNLEFQMPIYNRNDIRLNEQREIYEIMKKKSQFSLKQREILAQVDSYYNTISRVVEERTLVRKQTELMSEKMTVAKEQFGIGIIRYRTYSDAIKDYLTYKDEYTNMQQQYMQNSSILSIIIGKKSFYE